MARTHLGKTIDLHCGGQDLIFPHHENEIAQSECANGCEFSRYWMHNGFLNIDNRKMSKSAGNFFTVRGDRRQVRLRAHPVLHAQRRLPHAAELHRGADRKLQEQPGTPVHLPG